MFNLKTSCLIKGIFFFCSDGAHIFSFYVLLAFAMLLLLTASAPLQCPAAQQIWKYFDELHQLSMHVSSESLQGYCCTQILHWQQPSPSFCYIPNTTTWHSIVCFINLLMSSSKYNILEGTFFFMLCFQLQLKRILGQAVHVHETTKSL